MNYKLITCCFILVLTSFGVQADNSSHRKAAEKFLLEMELESTLEEMIDVALDMELVKNQSLIPYKQTMKDFFSIYMSFDSLLPDYVDMYVDAFSEKELEEMTAFFSTPTGKKSIKLSPILFQQGAQLGQQRVTENLEHLESMIQDEVARIQELQAASE